MTRFAYDLSILKHPRAGTARYAVELLAAMRASAGRDELLEVTGWPRGPRGSRRWRAANVASDIGWLTIGANLAAARYRVGVWYSPANTLPLLMPRPAVVTIHDTNFLSVGDHDRAYAAYARHVYAASGQRATAVIADSADARDRISTGLGVPLERIVVAYPGIDHGGGIAADPVPGVAEPYVLFVGQTEPHKNVVRLVEAWDRGVPPELRLVIAGPAGRGEDAVRAAIASSPAAGRIDRLDSVTESRLASLYAHATCVVLPSLAEGFGFPPLEAMRHGVPAAVANATSLPEVTRGAAVTFDPYDREAIADAIRRLATDAGLRNDLITAGRAVAASYTWASTAATVWIALREAIE
ncbi:MAG: glycosyltransferase family 4 protein [Chloroflexota bacterium]